MKFISTRAIFLVFAMSLSISAQAALLFVADLNGLQEVPTNPSPATGFGSVLLSDDQTTISVSLNFSGLLSPQVAAHIHGPAAPGVNASVVFPLPIGQVTNAVFSVTPAQVATLTNELFYFNVHTTLLPGGEIRGQIQAVPEPAALSLILLGIAGIAVMRRRRAGRAGRIVSAT